MRLPHTLEEEIATAFARACHERDWEIAEFLFQALEAIAEREGNPSRVDEAYGELLKQFTRSPRRTPSGWKRSRL
jgi:hypothetical protein